MSVSVEAPLHFQSSQPPSSPPFSSPPQSPSHRLHAQTPTSPPPPSTIDIDMSTSVTTLAPAGQRHDREDADMQDGDGPTSGQHENTTTNLEDRALIPSSVAVEVAAVDEDVMDTTPDVETEPVQPGSTTNPLGDTAITPSSPDVNEAPVEVAASNDIPAPPLPPPADAQAEPTPSNTELTNPFAELNSQPPPPPPPVEPIRSESDSSDDDDGLQPWHPITEDTSSPDEAELKDIEATTEHSALDHEYWESKAFLPLEEPEYTAGVSGRIHWNIDAYNGTREKPNREIVMKSEVATVGGHQWQIKFYPKGNDSDYLSVYLECLSVMKKKEDKTEDGPSPNEETAPSDANCQESEQTPVEENAKAEPTKEPAPEEPVEMQHTPLPLLNNKTLPKRKSVAAQVSVVMYNPTEPRVHYSRTALHRFCGGSPDWGWTRFHGPYYDIAHRMRNQRQALLRDDKLAFTAYIRVVEDETNCLWEHHSRDNPWDSFAMAGLQSLVLGQDVSAPGGNMISAVASWLLFKPFRHLLYSITLPDPADEPQIRPKPLLCAFQKVLYMLRTFVEPGAGPVALDDILDALDWYHIHDRLDKLDVMEVWEVLRAKLEEELRDTEQSSALQDILGPKRDYTAAHPKYRVPVTGVETMQDAVNSSANFVADREAQPQLLSIELHRQEFDPKTRSYNKLLNKVALDDHITVNGTSYTLYGFVVHKQTLQSNVYQPVIRPEGPGSRWYNYSDSKDENQVKCLTKRQAIDDHEGKAGKDKVIGNDAVAYIAMYVRDDITKHAFVSDAASESWDIPEWMKVEVEKDRSANDLTPIPPLPLQDAPASGCDDKVAQEEKEEPAQQLNFEVVNSKIFAKHEGPGVFDAYNQKWLQDNSEHVSTIQLSSKSSIDEVRNKLAALYPDIQDPRQVIFFFVDPVHGAFGRPHLLSTGKVEYSRGSYDRFMQMRDWALGDAAAACRRLWVHIVDFASLPELPKVEEKAEEKNESNSAPVVEEMREPENNGGPEVAAVPPPETEPQGEDTPMSDPEDEPLAQPDAPQPAAAIPPPPVQADAGDTAMISIETAQVPDPPVVDVVVPEPVQVGDTEMGGTQEESQLPPAPPISIPAEIMQPPPPARPRTPEPPPDEIYFFLKFWNPETQKLESRGSHVALKSARVDETVVTRLGFPMEDKKKVELWEEEEFTARTLKHRRTFLQLDLHNTTVIIGSLPVTPDQRSTLAAKALPADPPSYLAHTAFARNFPDKLNGHVTYAYFSDEYYKGEITNGHRHGHGTRIYHSGATYTGSFRLGSRHGHGVYTFQNGDTYDGDWVDNQQHGTGTFVEAATGNTYVGGWKNDKKFGEGVTHWKNAQEEERMCRICWDEAADAAFYDCGHVVACVTCAREVQTCPVCRKRVLSAMKLYYVA